MSAWQARPLTTAQADEPWRVGSHYRIHVYAGNRPVATFHRAEDALAAVKAHNDSLTEPELEDLTDELQAWSGEARQIAEETLPLAVEVWPEPSPVVAPTPAACVNCGHPMGSHGTYGCSSGYNDAEGRDFHCYCKLTEVSE